jgi:hypothetical protein
VYMNGSKKKYSTKKLCFTQQTIVEKILCFLGSIYFITFVIVALIMGIDINYKSILACIGGCLYFIMGLYLTFTGYIIIDTKKKKIFVSELFHRVKKINYNTFNIVLTEDKRYEEIWSIVISSDQGYMEIKSWGNSGPLSRMTLISTKKQKRRVKKFINKIGK